LYNKQLVGILATYNNIYVGGILQQRAFNTSLWSPSNSMRGGSL